VSADPPGKREGTVVREKRARCERGLVQLVFGSCSRTCGHAGGDVPARYIRLTRFATGHSSRSHADLLHDQLQTTLGPAYTLERELGRGGMSRVRRACSSRVSVARAEALGRDVVVKVIGPGQAEGLSAERLALEPACVPPRTAVTAR
jgi:hypothetical protein